MKNHMIWTYISTEIKEQNEERKLIVKREKLVKFHKIDLIYKLKLKYRDIRQKIRWKTCNITCNDTKNDPINFMIKAFDFSFQKTKVEFKRQILPSPSTKY